MDSGDQIYLRIDGKEYSGGILEFESLYSQGKDCLLLIDQVAL